MYIFDEIEETIYPKYVINDSSSTVDKLTSYFNVNLKNNAVVDKFEKDEQVLLSLKAAGYNY